MANRYFNQFHGTPQKGVVILPGTLSIAADASISSQDFKMGTFTKTGTGEYTLTLSDKYVGALSVLATVQAATAVDLVAQVKSVDVVSAKTVVFNLNTGATPTNPSAVCKLNVVLILSNSTSY